MNELMNEQYGELDDTTRRT